MDVFELHRRVVADYAAYIRSFIRIGDERILQAVTAEIEQGLLWPEPLLQLNPAFETGETVDELVQSGVLQPECSRMFRMKTVQDPYGRPLRLHRHQTEAIRLAQRSLPYVLTTGTGSGKSLAYIIPAVDYVLRNGTGRGVQAIVVYPMNALANSQKEELDKFLKLGYGEGTSPVTYARYTGQEDAAARERILREPPDILLTNYVMLELILTRVDERQLVEHASNLRFLILDELHTYRGRQGADVAMLVRRCREAFSGDDLICIGTSATMASEGDSEAQARTVAAVASEVFGQEVGPQQVVGESLRRITADIDFDSANNVDSLRSVVLDPSQIPGKAEEFRENALASWIESVFGLRREECTGKLVRQTPRAISGDEGAALELATLTNSDRAAAEHAVQDCLRAGASLLDDETGFPLFPFRLHQFITRGDTIWSSLEPEDRRFLTLRGQQFVPGDRDRILLPLVFCRECGQPYYRVDRPIHGKDDPVIPKERFERTISEEYETGYLYFSSEHPWTGDFEDVMERIPDDWIETRPDGTRRVKRKQPVPEIMRLAPNGRPAENGLAFAFVPTPFRFCLNPECSVAYSARQRSDLSKLATIGVDGRSTATSVLALSTILKLRVEETLEDKARKLLSFTDNRQDASLQAGHFNDFVEVGLIRSALFRAMQRVGEAGLAYDELVQHVERAMDLPIDLYANDPEIRGPALQETRRALRSVLAYFLYRDLQRGWRVTSPNLEQCGLLRIEYLGLDDAACDMQFWQDRHAHATLIASTAAQRADVIRTLLDHMRRSLAVKEDTLNPTYQERISEQSRQRLRDPWVIEDPATMERAGVAWPRSRGARERHEDIFVSPQSNFGLYLRRPGVMTHTEGQLTLDDTATIVADLFQGLKKWGLVEEVRSPRQGGDVPGYQVPASVMHWRAGDGSCPLVDPLRVTRETDVDRAANQYFVEFYKTFADSGAGLEAREHTAQVPSDVRIEREQRFRAGDLPILFCSPTMELGVDIAQLNVVNMRNVPPTPANYAQRSGRAGRSGQPALVYTYCSGFSPHDQYYFRHPNGMVCGAVSAPRLDLLNRDLIQAHVHAVWLSEAQMNLGQTLTDVLVVTEDDLSLPLKSEIEERLRDATVRLRALERAKTLLQRIGPELGEAPWYRDDWVDDVLARLPQTFDEACTRWRSLYKAAVQQRHLQNQVIGDHSRPAIDRERAKRLRAQAESQIQLLTSPQGVIEGDFYSYRYFASEAFLPGYSFPRLPLSAFIPARRGRRGRDEYLSRPRFLAISEFGPQALVYHEGARYVINKVNLAFDREGQDLTKATMKACSVCGYGHLVASGPGVDICDNCHQPLYPRDEIREMVRLQNVTARRKDRITSDEEERQRIGYEIRTSFRFSDVDAIPDVRTAEVASGPCHIATLKYGDTATIWRVNLGWLRRSNPNEKGFLLDVERGYWARNREVEDGDRDDPMSRRVERVVPYVEDRRNALTVEFEVRHDASVMASLQSALKQAIQQLYQLEPEELAAEAMPSRDDRRLLFFYEAAEGGAGVLRQLVEDADALSRIARTAIEICHFDPDTGEDHGGEAGNGVGCEAACYDCLLEYGNQLDHRIIDRKKVIDVLRDLAQATVRTAPGRQTREDLLAALNQGCDSQLEKKWLRKVEEKRLRVPSHGQHLISACRTRADFFYKDANAAVYVDGPPHDEPDQQAEDQRITDCLLAAGYLVIRFHHAADWDAVFRQYRDIFGGSQ
jgi:very-short-patch-repair endonuclease